MQIIMKHNRFYEILLLQLDMVFYMFPCSLNLYYYLNYKNQCPVAKRKLIAILWIWTVQTPFNMKINFLYIRDTLLFWFCLRQTFTYISLFPVF